MRCSSWLCICFFLTTGSALAQDAPPRSVDPRLKVELFAEDPQIVTPTGIDVDARGRVWAIESNTHFPPQGYAGHPSDRLLVMSSSTGSGRADRIEVFTDELKHAMSVALRPAWLPAEAKQEVFVATRREIRLFFDDDGDDRADRSTRIVHLETKGDYPHNGLAGFAFDALGWMYFGFGENLGADYQIIGSDGTTLSGGGEGGNVYRCRLDGSKLQRWATGFWNPHASCTDAFGRLFTVDNDPDSRPPCRLLHIIPAGDYGYRFRNGRKGLHPFTSWNGEIPGTLPMVAGTGEAPSGILAYESNGLPEEYLGNLLCTSWGDHRIDRFRLKPKGASFESLAEPLIVGGENFRPVGIACAPDGSLYCTDWVLKDYNVHGRGRVWRISTSAEHRPAARKVVDESGIEGLSSKSLARRRTAAFELQRTPEGRAKLLAFYLNAKNNERGRIEAATAFVIELKSFDEFLDSNRIPKSEQNSDGVGLADMAYYQASFDNPRLNSDSMMNDVRKLGGHQAIIACGEKERRSSLPPQMLETLRIMASEFDLEDIWEVPERARSVHLERLNAALDGDDAFIYSTLVTALASHSTTKLLLDTLDAREIQSETARAAFTLAARICDPQAKEFIRRGLSDKSAIVARHCIQWVAEEKFQEFRPQVEALLNDPQITADLFLAVLAALEMLDGVPPAQFDQTPPGKYVLPLVRDDQRPAAVRTLALRMVDPADPALDAPLLANLLQSNDPALRLETVRTLQSSPIAQALRLLIEIAADEQSDESLRAEALVGLSHADDKGKPSPEAKALLIRLLAEGNAVLRSEALRSLRAFAASDSQVRQAIEKLSATPEGTKSPLKQELALALDGTKRSAPALAENELRAALVEPTRESDNPQTGRRVFYHTQSAGCFRCHTINGRGGKIGPDLSTIGRSLSRARLIESILEPSREIAPQFVAWSFETTSGKVHTGMIVHENEGKTVIGDTEGKLTELKTIDIVGRWPQQASVMPDKLAERLTLQEFRDLLAYLESLR